MKRLINIILIFLLVISSASCQGKDNSNIADELKNAPSVYTGSNTGPAEELTDEELFSYICQLEGMLTSVSTSGCEDVNIANIKDFGNLLKSHRNDESKFAALSGYAGDLIEKVTNCKYRIYDYAGIYGAYDSYKSEFEELGKVVTGERAPLSRFILNQAMMTAYLVGYRDYNQSAVTFAGGVSFTTAKSGVTFDRVIESVGGDFGFPLENMQALFFSDTHTVVSNNSVIVEDVGKSEQTPAYRATTEYIDIYTEQSIDAISTENRHMYDYGSAKKAETEKLITDSGYKLINNVTACDLSNGSGAVRVISFNFSGKESDDAYISDAVNKASFCKEDAVFLIAYVYWGEGENDKVTDFQKEMARKLLDGGADMVIGLSESTVSGIENINGKYVFYNIGQLVNANNPSVSPKQSFAVQVVFDTENNKTVLKEVFVIPYYANSNGENWNNYQPTIQYEGALDRIIKELLSKSSSLANGVKEIKYFKTTG